MARIAEGWKIRRPAGRTVYKVRFTVRDKRYDLSTGKRDRVEAAHEAERLYALAVEGRLDGQLPPPGTASLRPLAGPLSEWLASLVTTHDESTRETYAQYGLRWCRRWPTLAEVTRGAVADYARERLGQVARGSVQKEMSALRGLLLWAEEHALIPQAPPPVVLPDRATGTRATTRHEGTTDLTPEQVSAILLRLPEWSSDKAGRWRVRDYFILMAETGLRPATLCGLRYPDHWRPGQTEVQIPRELDKARWGRAVPLTAAAVAALVRSCPEAPGLIYGAKRREGWLRRAARAAGLPEAIARRVVPYDLRHARATELLAAGATVPGVQQLLGHRQIGTTSRYLHPTASHARAALETVSRPVLATGADLVPLGWEERWCAGTAAVSLQPSPALCAKGGT